MKYKIIKGDILHLEEPVDAIVNSANRFMSKGGGVCGKIHDMAGHEFTEYCCRKGGLKVGHCKITPGFKLAIPFVIHALSPIWGRYENPEEVLMEVYKDIFQKAQAEGYTKIALPLLGGGHHGYPQDVALSCAEKSFQEFESDTLEAILVLF